MTGQPRSSAAPALLAVEDLRVGYGEGPAVLEGVSLQVPAGGAVAVVGANGAGKTTLVRAISGLLDFHGGQVREGRAALEGADLAGRTPHQVVAAGVGQVPEGRMVFGNLTVAENLRVGALGAGRTREHDAQAARVYELFPQLAERRDQQAGWMSGGEQQMVAIGRALMAMPSLLLLDEVSLGLAPRIIGDIAARLGEIRRSLGTALLIVEQNAAVALRLCERVLVLERGRVVAEGSPDELGDRIRGAYLGD